ncbi:MAG: DUF3073 family protein [Ornithinimicrobium sp.]|uniref:DUF3073 family protein n=1 Tax=Ornithinimicrobium sp. TaxID=1977084 RepID=UPI0026DFF599|nr:DUF3073 family protein [Ornithinimicrobium sp.]MDO5739933.1 DUF3073 family protein [Ornithinimicrobium sp.]
MGRGRAKAKQIKVARRLKYSSGPTTDLTALERELHRSRGDIGERAGTPFTDGDDDDETDTAYAVDDDRPWAAGDER